MCWNDYGYRQLWSSLMYSSVKTDAKILTYWASWNALDLGMVRIAKVRTFDLFYYLGASRSMEVGSDSARLDIPSCISYFCCHQTKLIKTMTVMPNTQNSVQIMQWLRAQGPSILKAIKVIDWIARHHKYSVSMAAFLQTLVRLDIMILTSCGRNPSL